MLARARSRLARGLLGSGLKFSVCFVSHYMPCHLERHVLPIEVHDVLVVLRLERSTPAENYKPLHAGGLVCRELACPRVSADEACALLSEIVSCPTEIPTEGQALSV